MTFEERDERAQARRRVSAGNLARAAEPLLHESPYSVALRPLANEPLTVDDWGEVHRAQRAFIMQVRMIVVRARQRAGSE